MISWYMCENFYNATILNNDFQWSVFISEMQIIDVIANRDIQHLEA